MTTSVLIVDRERGWRARCADGLKSLGMDTLVADGDSRALAILESSRINVVLASARAVGHEGLELLKVIKRNYPRVEVVLVTESVDAEEVARALRLGAFGYLTKPFKAGEVKHLFRLIAERQELADENRLLREKLKAHRGFGTLVGTSLKMEPVYRLITKVAASRHPVLVLGESGTGKELVARAIHSLGPRSSQPFVPVDCGALTPTLIESELFGHVRGAFTGASETRQGLLAAARSGTVFLDEIAELPVELQSRLLRALQEREYKPIGSNSRHRFEARIIAATNQDLPAAVKRGTFRKDLYFRLNVVTIKVPPLRDRRSDIPLLVHAFIDKHGGAEGRKTGVSYEAMTHLMKYDWPGNVRELENCIQRALALGSGPAIEVKDLPSSLINSQGSAACGQEVATLRELERRAILQALEATGGDRLRAARLLGIGKTTIYRKLKEYGVERAPGSTPPA